MQKSIVTYTAYLNAQGQTLTKDQVTELYRTDKKAAEALQKDIKIFDEALPLLDPKTPPAYRYSEANLSQAMDAYQIKALAKGKQLLQIPVSDKPILITADEGLWQQYQNHKDESGYWKVMTSTKPPKTIVTYTTIDQSIKKDWAADYREKGDEPYQRTLVVTFGAGYPEIVKGQAVLPFYKPTYNYGEIDWDLFKAFHNAFEKGQFTSSEIDDAFRRYSGMVQVANTHYYGGGTIKGQMGRLRAVLDVAAQKQILPMNYEEYEEYMNSKYPLVVVPSEPKTIWINDVGKMETALSNLAKEAGYDKPFLTFNVDADAGTMYAKGGKMEKKLLTVNQDIDLATAYISGINTVVGDKMLSTAMITAMKNKDEVYELSQLGTKTRNIFVYNSGTQLPAMLLYNAVHVDFDPYDPVKNPVLAGFSPWFGGMDSLVVTMLNHASKNGVAYAVYADNLYVVYRHKNGVNWVSLDGAKMEATITKDLVQFEAKRMLKALQEAGHILTPEWEKYAIDHFPKIVTESVGVIGQTQIPLKQMGSGCVGTFTYNTLKMLTLLRALEAQIKNDVVVLVNGTWQFTPWFAEMQANVGVKLTVESVIPNIHDDIMKVGNVLPLDLLGFSGIVTDVGDERPYILPILSPDRFRKTLVFQKSKLAKSSDMVTRHLVKTVRYVSCWILGGWVSPAVNKILRRQIWSSYSALISQAKGKGISEEAMLAELQRQGMDYSDPALSALIDKVDNNASTVLFPSIVKMMKLVGFPDTRYLIEKLRGTVKPELLAPASEFGKAITVNPTVKERLTTRIPLELFVTDKSLEIPSKGITVPEATSVVPTLTLNKKGSTQISDQASQRLDKMLALMLGKGVVLNMVVPVNPTYRTASAMKSIENLGAFLTTNVWSELAQLLSIPAEIVRTRALSKKDRGKIKVLLSYSSLPKDAKMIDNVLQVRGPGNYFFNTPGAYRYQVWIKPGTAFYPQIDYNWYESQGVDIDDIRYCMRNDKPIILGKQPATGQLPSAKRGAQKKITSDVKSTNAYKQVLKQKSLPDVKAGDKSKPKEAPKLTRKWSEVVVSPNKHKGKSGPLIPSGAMGRIPLKADKSKQFPPLPPSQAIKKQTVAGEKRAARVQKAEDKKMKAMETSMYDDLKELFKGTDYEGGSRIGQLKKYCEEKFKGMNVPMKTCIDKALHEMYQLARDTAQERMWAEVDKEVKATTKDVSKAYDKKKEAKKPPTEAEKSEALAIQMLQRYQGLDWTDRDLRMRNSYRGMNLPGLSAKTRKEFEINWHNEMKSIVADNADLRKYSEDSPQLFQTMVKSLTKGMAVILEVHNDRENKFKPTNENDLGLINVFKRTVKELLAKKT
jgi:hypothetical protein